MFLSIWICCCDKNIKNRRTSRISIKKFLTENKNTPIEIFKLCKPLKSDLTLFSWLIVCQTILQKPIKQLFNYFRYNNYDNLTFCVVYSPNCWCVTTEAIVFFSEVFIYNYIIIFEGVGF